MADDWIGLRQKIGSHIAEELTIYHQNAADAMQNVKDENEKNAEAELPQPPNHRRWTRMSKAHDCKK